MKFNFYKDVIKTPRAVQIIILMQKGMKHLKLRELYYGMLYAGHWRCSGISKPKIDIEMSSIFRSGRITISGGIQSRCTSVRV